MFLNIAGVPAHPLFVHLAVVAVPVVAILAIVSVALLPRGAKSTEALRLTNAVLSIVAALAVVVASSAGESLLASIGLSEHNPGNLADHVLYADLAKVFAIGLMVLAVALWGIHQTRFRLPVRIPGFANPVVCVLLVIVALAAIVATVLVGHSGAAAVWDSHAVGR